MCFSVTVLKSNVYLLFCKCWYFFKNVFFCSCLHLGNAFLVAQMVKRLPAVWETRVQFLGREDPLEKEMAIHSSTLAWKIPWMEEPDRLVHGVIKRRTRLSDFTFTFICIYYWIERSRKSEWVKSSNGEDKKGKIE